MSLDKHQNFSVYSSETDSQVFWLEKRVNLYKKNMDRLSHEYGSARGGGGETFATWCLIRCEITLIVYTVYR